MQITNASQLCGVFPALFTPLKDDDPKNLHNSIDYEKMKKMIDDLINAGVSGILPVGTTGQSATVTHKQHLDIIKFTLDYVDGRVPVIAGAGSNCTRESVEMIQEVEKIAEVPVLCVTGYYNNPEMTEDKLGGKYYDTGDVAWRDSKGYYWFVGRNDDVIKCSGYRIGPFEVESAMLEHPAVVECAITGAPDPIR